MEIKDYRDGDKQVPVTQEEKKIQPVVHAKGTRKRNKFVSMIIAEEFQNVKRDVIGDVLIPAFKKLIVDTVENSIEMLILGHTGNSKKSGSSRVSYRSYYDDDRRDRPRNYRSSSYEFDDLVFETRGEAEIILDNMFDIIDKYRVVTVADLYDLAGEPGRYTDNKYGWTNIDTAQIVRIRDGFVIKLPRALAID